MARDSDYGRWRRSDAFDLPLLRERAPKSDAPVPSVSTPSSTETMFPDCLVYSAFIERTRSHALFDEIRGSLVLVEDSSSYVVEEPREDDVLVLPTPRMEFEAIVRKLPHERIQQIRQQIRREQPYGSIDGMFAIRVGDAILERITLRVDVEGERRGDYATMAKPLVRDAYGLFLRDASKTKVSSGTYFVYDFLTD